MNIKLVRKPGCESCHNMISLEEIPLHFEIDGQVFCPCGHCGEPVGFDEKEDRWYHVLLFANPCFYSGTRLPGSVLIP